MKHITFDEVIAELVGHPSHTQSEQQVLDTAMRTQLRQSVIANKATHVVLFRNNDMWSSQLGSKTAMCVGPTCTCTTPEECEGKHLNDLPSQRQYPYAYCEVPNGTNHVGTKEEIT